MGNSTYRLHRFRAAAAAIKGMTADVLVCPAESLCPVSNDFAQILTAAVAYGKPPSFDWYAPDQFSTLEETMQALDLTAFNKWNHREPVVATDGTKVARPVSLE